jgi:hypothetical protein
MKLIESKTLGTAAASIEFTSIPQTFTDLVILASCRSNRDTQFSDWFFVSFNSNTSNYSGRIMEGSGSVVDNYSAFPRVFGLATAAGATSNTFGNSATYVPNYAGATNKSWSVDQVVENNAAQSFLSIVAGLWSDTSAITSIALTPRVGTQFEIGSTVSLYGILKGSDGIVTTS